MGQRLRRARPGHAGSGSQSQNKTKVKSTISDHIDEVTLTCTHAPLHSNYDITTLNPQRSDTTLALTGDR